MIPGKYIIVFIAMLAMGMTCRKENSVISIQGFHIRDANGIEGKPNFKVGFGDIRICDSQIATQCF
jgi:hypothetical protein